MKKAFRVAEIDGRDTYRLLAGLIVPRPIGWIGTMRPDGVKNLAPYSFFNMIGDEPPLVMFAAGKRDGALKDSAAYAIESGEFSVNIVSVDVVEAMNATSASFPPDVDEFDECGLTAWFGIETKAPLVAEAPANLECRVYRTVDFEGDEAPVVVFGEVVAIHVREELLDGSRIDHAALDAVGRLAGAGYATTRDRFELVRP